MRDDKGFRKIDIEELKKRVVATPMTGDLIVNDESLKAVEGHFREIMKIMKLDLEDDSLERTPYRVSKMFLKEIFYGLDWKNFPEITAVENKMGYDQAITESNITFMSCCEHHILPVIGVCHLSYLPKKYVLGLSKFNRIVDFFARRPQVQERATHQILQTLQYVLETEDIAITIDAIHTCVKLRGVKDQNTITRTTALGGNYLSLPELRNEYMLSIPRSNELKSI